MRIERNDKVFQEILKISIRWENPTNEQCVSELFSLNPIFGD